MVGVPGGSSGIAIARRLGLSEEIIERARALLLSRIARGGGLDAYLHPQPRGVGSHAKADGGGATCV